MDTVVLIATVPAIVALVNFFKKLGVPARASLALAVVLGVVLSLAQFFWGDEGWFTAAANGLLLGLSASGLYDLVPKGATQVANVSVPNQSSSRPVDVSFTVGEDSLPHEEEDEEDRVL